MIRALVRKSATLDRASSQCSTYAQNTRIGRYWASLYEEPHPSERVLGRFFFYKTTLLTAIAFYSQDPLTLTLILAFSTVFDALTGIYQHTLMNFCHRTYFEKGVLHAAENLVRRFAIDIVRAEVITIFAVGFLSFSADQQSHVLINRLGSGTYYLNAALLDKLVSGGVLGRTFRSWFIIFASTLGSLLTTLHLARTQPPSWFPASVNHLGSLFSPMTMLLVFNGLVFLFMGTLYLRFGSKKLVRMNDAA